MADQLVAKNLIRWNQPGGETLGIVVRVEAGGRRVVVRLDSGGEQMFVWPSEVIERLQLPRGQHVKVLASNTVGVISAARAHNGIVLYQVSLPGGQAPMVMEDGVRPAAITDPIERLRAGELNSARSTNLRLAATRLIFAYQHDELLDARELAGRAQAPPGGSRSPRGGELPAPVHPRRRGWPREND
jgi:hypothetical protein